MASPSKLDELRADGHVVEIAGPAGAVRNVLTMCGALAIGDRLERRRLPYVSTTDEMTRAVTDAAQLVDRVAVLVAGGKSSPLDTEHLLSIVSQARRELLALEVEAIRTVDRERRRS